MSEHRSAQSADVMKTATSSRPNAKTEVLAEAAQEFVFGVVGHIGSGTSNVARAFKELLERQKPPFEANIIKARDVIEDWAKKVEKEFPAAGATKTITIASQWQDLGDEMRNKDTAAVATGLIRRIRGTRGVATNAEVKEGEPVTPDGVPRAYILDALRHPAEVNLLRHLYQDAFVLIGVVCDPDVREARLRTKFQNPAPNELREFMKRDEKDNRKHGQQVAKTFQLADFYVDNTPDRFLYTESGEKREENPEWDINEKLGRLVRIVAHDGIERPEVSETAMHHAYSAQMRSACLSRQVGAALLDRDGNLLSTGTNEVPKAGGGVYGESFSGEDQPRLDQRCAYRPDKYCSSTKEQNQIIDGIIEDVSSIQALTQTKRAELRRKLKDGRVGDTIEFSRAVHAEMDALLSASRSGGGTVGTRLFVTTFPCHYCARHIISAGVDEVQYIEPYFKSLASMLHSDAIQQRLTGWKPPSKGGATVLFRPFTGVAPRLYRRAFMKDRDLKNDDTGDLNVSAPEWGTSWHLRKKSYLQLEAQLAGLD
jgi:deoxycytidylate deaminase/dephospho-CoA kinase